MTAIKFPVLESSIRDRDLLLPCEIYQAWRAAQKNDQPALAA